MVRLWRRRHTGQCRNVTISSHCNNIAHRRAVVLASGRKVSVPWARTGKLLTVTTDLAMASAEMEIASGLKACPRRARNWTTSTLCRFERGWENVETLKSFPPRLEPEPTMLSTSSETPRTKMLRRSRSTKCWTKSRSNTLSDHVGPWSDSMYSFTF